MRTKIWYSVSNCGDGSAYPTWVESEELAHLHQEYMLEGWGEECVSYIEIEHDGPIRIVDELMTAEEMKEEALEDLEYATGNYKNHYEEKIAALDRLIAKKNDRPF